MKKIKTLLSMVLVLCCIASTLTFTAYADDEISVYIDNEIIAFDVEPIMIMNRVMVPMRKIFEALGAKVKWDDETQTVTATREVMKKVADPKTKIQRTKKVPVVISFKIGDFSFTKDGAIVNLDVAPTLINDRTMVPIRAISEALDCHVKWYENPDRVMIYTDEILPLPSTSSPTTSEEDSGELKCSMSISKSEISSGTYTRIMFSAKVQAKGGEGGYTYKFQLLQNGTVIDEQRYSDNNSFSSEIKGNGEYKIIAYTKDKSGNISTCETELN